MDYHDYSVEWTKDSISWFVDYKWAYTEKRMLIDEPMYIRLNHWAAAIVNNNFIYNWLGPVDVKKLPSTVYYDFIKYTPM
jgi:beta-glucanase (GH16 family)